LLVDGLRKLGWKLSSPKAGLYVWVPTPPRYTSVRFSVLLRKSGVFVVPGAFMGEYGEGYVRFALSTSEAEMQLVLDRIEHGLSRRRRLRRLQASQFSVV
ncbi:MAG: aminotransferase class I/II-fold pyridoxal phosphate-dependent enzyme, partial [Candidatus Latescibacteria bacterium]|nr:aminotransferase class I/II-fold pyridoxal phosphate-dependent enzyme [Candidatus Latescibacterota bacterium]